MRVLQYGCAVKQNFKNATDLACNRKWRSVTRKCRHHSYFLRRQFLLFRYLHAALPSPHPALPSGTYFIPPPPFFMLGTLFLRRLRHLRPALRRAIWVGILEQGKPHPL